MAIGVKVSLGVCAAVALVAVTVYGALVYRRPTEEDTMSIQTVPSFISSVNALEEERKPEEEPPKFRRTGYRRGDMVAARRIAVPGFSVASIARVHRDSEMQVNELTVRWYRPYGAKQNDRFASSYTAAWTGSNPAEDRISVNSIYLRFDELSPSNTLPLEVRGALGDPNTIA